MTRRLFFAIAAMGVAQVAVYVARPTTSYRLLGLGYGARAVGLVAAAFALLPLFLAIPLGRLSDRRGGAPLLLAGCALQTLGCLLLAAAGSAPTLAGASVVLGLGHLGLALGVQDLIARESSVDRHDQHFGLLTAAVSLGQLVGPLIGGLLLGDRTGGALASAAARALLVAAAFAGLATVCALVADFSRAPAHAARAQRSHGSVRVIARTRGVPAGIFASIAVLSAADVFTAYLPVLGEQRGIGPRVVGALLAVRAGASVASRVGIGALVRHIGRVRLIALSAVAAAAALGAFTVTENIPLLVLLSLVAGFGLGFSQPLSMTMVVQVVPESARATALGLRLTGNRLGQVVAPAASGVVAGASGAGAVFWLLSGMLVASAVAIRRSGLTAAAAEPETVLAD